VTEPTTRLVHFFRLLIGKPVAVLMLVLAILGASTIATLRIPIEMFPSGLASTSIFISAPWPGANPTEVETRVVRPLEDELRTLTGVEETIAVAAANSGIIILSYPGDTDMDQAQAEVADRVERVRPLLPSDADRVSIRRFQSSDIPIMWVGVTYAEDQFEYSQDVLANVLGPRLEAVDGVAAANLDGLLPTSVRILLNKDAVVANRVEIGQLVQRLQADNLSAPVGDLDDAGSRYIIRVDSRFQSLEEIRAFPVRPGLTLNDIGRVEWVRSAPDNYFKVNGEFAVGISIQKETSANTFEVCQELKRVIEVEIQHDPELAGMKYSIFFNQGENVQQNLEALVKDAALGGAIACVVLMLFLRRFRYTLLVALSIPFSVLVTLAYLYFTGDSFNILTMTGITVSIGMLVDNSVVIVESIFARRERGEDLGKACANGPAEVMLAVVTATLTTVVVFVPLIFMSTNQNARVLTGSIGIPLCVSLIAALLLAIVIVPVVSYRLGAKKTEQQRRRGRLGNLLDRFSLLGWLQRRLPRLVDWSLNHPVQALSIALVCLLSTGVAQLGSQTGGGLQLGSELNARFKILGAIDLDEAHEHILALEGTLLEPELLKEIGNPDVGIFFNRTRGSINLWHEQRPNPEREKQILELLQQRLPRMAALEYRFGEEFNDRNTQDQKGWARLELEGPDSRVLAQLTEMVRQRAMASGLFEQVSEAEDTSRELLVQLDRDVMVKAGVNSQTMVGNIEWNLRGFMVSRFQTAHEDIPIILEYDDPGVPDRSDLTDMSIWTGNASLPLSSFATFDYSRGPASIARHNGRTVTSIGLKAKKGDLKKAAKEIRSLMNQVELPEGYHWNQLGGMEEFNEGLQDILRALTLSIALVFLLMGLLFNSLILPFSVLVTVPFAYVGFTWAFRISGVEIDLLAWVGMIVLAGVVVNNGIVLLDRILHLENQGVDRRTAILEGVRDRLRPVLMTALTTICGLLPIALSQPGSGGFSFQGLAVGVSGGLLISTVFTLWTVPLIYSLLRDVAAWHQRLRKGPGPQTAQ
jgi:hydrophobic/amphiphilic exporter-1 (mainly G- bacteria), HAE1 family